MRNPFKRMVAKLYDSMNPENPYLARKEEALLRLAADNDERRQSVSTESGDVVSAMDRIGGEGVANPHALLANNLSKIDEMMQDEAVGTFVEMKKSGALSVDYKIIEASDEPKDVEIKDCVWAGYENIHGQVVDAMYDQLSAIEYGFSVANVTFEYMETGDFAGKLGISQIKTKPPHFIRFDTDEYLNILDDGILFVNPDSMQVERMPKKEFAVYTYRKRFANPYGYGDCIRAYDRWNSKRYVNKFWDIFLERHANATILAQYRHDKVPPAKEFNDVKSMVNRKQARSSLIYSDLWTMDIKEPSMATSDAFERAIAQRNIAIARAMLLPDLLGFSGISGGTYALGKKHFDVFLWILLRIHKDLSEIHTEQVIRRLVDLNYGPQGAYPRMEFEPLTDEQKVQWMSQVVQAIEKGVITKDLEIENEVRRRLELAEKEQDEEEKAGGSPPAPPADDMDDVEDADFEAPEPARLRRRPTQFEMKADLDTLVSFTNETEDAFVSRWSSLMRENQDNLITWMRRNKVIETGDYALVSKAPMSKSIEQRKALQRYLMAGSYFGSLQGQQEIERVRKSDMSLYRAMEFADPVDIPLTDIEKVFLDKGLITSPKIIKAASTAKRDGFFITNVENEMVLSKAKQIIMRGMKRGNLKWTEGQLKRMFDRYLSIGEVTDNKLGQEWRVRQIAQENFNRAMNEGKKAYYQDPDVEGFILAYQWSSIIDGAETPYCAAMDGKVFRKEELDAEGWPPAHFGCRSTVIAVTEGEKFTYSKIPSLERAAGFACCA